MATSFNIVIDQGTTYSNTITLTNDDSTFKDLTDYDVAAHIRKSYNSNTYTPFTCTKNALVGDITFSLTAEQTSALKYGRYVYDLEISSEIETLRVLEGIITVTPEVTR